MNRDLELRYINILKGIGIILVVFGHTHINENIRKYIYSFHMPLFFVISGYLSKKNFSFKYLISKFKKLIGSYCYFVAISFLVPIIFIAFGKSIKHFNYDLNHILYLNGKIIWNTPLWFLASLFFLEIIFSIFDKLIKNNKIKVILYICLNLYFYKIKIFLPFGISISLATLTLYYVGKILKKNENLLYKYINNIELLVLGLLGIVLSIYNGRIDLYKLEFSNSIILYYITNKYNFLFNIKQKIRKI